MENQQLQDKFRLLCTDKTLNQMIGFIKEHGDKVDIHNAFIQACVYNEIQVAKYLLHHCGADIHTKDDYGIRWACINNNNELAKYLLSSHELTEHADVRAAFSACCSFGNKHIIDFLIIDCGPQSLKLIQHIIDTSPSLPVFDYPQKIIDTVNLRDQLEETLPTSNAKNNKIKI